MTLPALIPAALTVRNLSIDLLGCARSPARRLVDGASFACPAGRITAIVGESGSGKTLTALSIMGLLPDGDIGIDPGSVIDFEGKRISGLAPLQLHALRGSRIAMIFQEPGSALNPVLTVGEQIAAPLRRHLRLSRREAMDRAVGLLAEVGIPEPAVRARSFPHELSGGQQQRVMIAMVIACDPALVFADEPTSALDVGIQKQILELLARIQRERSLSIVLITHDLGLAASIADHVVVFHRGQVREEGEAKQVLTTPRDSYTKELVEARLRLARGAQRQHSEAPGSGLQAGTPLLEVSCLCKTFTTRRGIRRRSETIAVRDVSFSLRSGETLGIVGESGSGKTTVALMLTGLVRASGGQARLDGQEILGLTSREFRHVRRRIQLVFQNPFASLNPRWTIRRSLIEPLELHGLGNCAAEREKRIVQLLGRVGLPATVLDRYPGQFSGGERQRIVIARALAVEPAILVCDEAVSALDVSVQVQVLDLLRDLQRDLGVAYLFISHDLTAVSYLAHRVMVMRAGQIVESGPMDTVLRQPAHPYTRELLASATVTLPGL